MWLAGAAAPLTHVSPNLSPEPGTSPRILELVRSLSEPQPVISLANNLLRTAELTANVERANIETRTQTLRAEKMALANVAAEVPTFFTFKRRYNSPKRIYYSLQLKPSKSIITPPPLNPVR